MSSTNPYSNGRRETNKPSDSYASDRREKSTSGSAYSMRDRASNRDGPMGNKGIQGPNYQGSGYGSQSNQGGPSYGSQNQASYSGHMNSHLNQGSYSYRDRGRERVSPANRERSPKRDGYSLRYDKYSGGQGRGDIGGYSQGSADSLYALEGYQSVSSRLRGKREREFRDPRGRDPRERDPRERDPRDREFRDSRDREFRDPRDSRNSRDFRDFGDRSRRGIRDNRGRDSYDRRNRGRDRPPRERGRRNEPEVPKVELPLDERIAQAEKKLQALEDAPRLEEIKVIDSRWGIMPKGFENVTAQRAKLSGLFPLPGFPRPIDFTKLEGALKDRLTNANDILNESLKIDPVDGKNARVLVVKNLDLDVINHLKVAALFNDALKPIDITETSVQNIESKRKTKRDNVLIVEFSNSVCATIIKCLFDNADIPFDSIKEDGVPDREDVRISIGRPGEYVVQDHEEPSDEMADVVKDGPRKVYLRVGKDALESELITHLLEIAPVKAFQLLREIGTKESVGLAFVQFSGEEAIPQYYSNVQALFPRIREIAGVEQVGLACAEPGVTRVQECAIDFNTLRELVRNEHVPPHPKLSVIQLLNVVTAKDLVDDDNYRFIQQDIQQEVSQYGEVRSMKIPRPANDYTPGLAQFSQPGLGRIFIEFEDEQTAFKAIMEIAGRMYNDRTVLCAFFDAEDYKNGLF